MDKLHIMGGLECIRVFSDHPKARPPFVGHRHVEYGGREWRTTIEQAQRAGAGVFFSVNGTDGVGASAENIERVRTYYVDIDDLEHKEDALERLITAKLKPSAIVETKNGVHAYWYAQTQVPVNHTEYRQVQQGLIDHFGGDNSVKDISRVLRLPSTLHLKDPKNPFTVRIVHQLPEDKTPYYSPEQLLREYPAPKPPVYTYTPVRDDSGSWGNFLEDLSRWDPIPGERNNTMLLCAGVAISYNVDEEDFVGGMYPIVKDWNTGRNELGELRRVARWAYARGTPIPAFVLRRKGIPLRRGL